MLRSELRPLLAGTVAGPFLEVGNEKMLGSVRSVMTSALGALDYTTRQEAEPFSVRHWVRSTTRVATGSSCAGLSEGGGGARARGGVLFLPYKAGEIAALRSVISAWLRLAIFEAMDGEEGDARLWFVVDELDAPGQIDGLKDALARLRKFGGPCILGFQSIAQVSATYGTPKSRHRPARPKRCGVPEHCTVDDRQPSGSCGPSRGYHNEPESRRGENLYV